MLQVNTPDTATLYNQQPKSTDKIFGHFISILFHPIFIPVYIVAFLIFLHPDAFTGFSMEMKMRTLLIIVLNIVFFPLLSVFLLRTLGFISSIYLKSQRDRIIPYIASGIFYFWAYIVFRGQPEYSNLLVFFLLGVFLVSSAGLMANIYFKISMHGLAMGGMLGFFLILSVAGLITFAWPLLLAFVLTGLVGTARLMVSTHKPADYYYGVLFGALCMIFAAIYIL